MAAPGTVSYVSDIIDYLKEVYQGPIHVLVNTETALKDWLSESQKKLLGGRGVFTPFTVVLSGNAGFIDQGGTLVNGKTGVTVRYNIQGVTIDGTTAFTMQAMDYSANDRMSFAEVMEKQMKELESVLSLTIDQAAYTGGPVKGLINTRATGAASTGDFAAVQLDPTKSGDLVVDYNGDLTPFASVNPANSNTWVYVNIIRLDNQLKISALANPGAPYGYTADAQGGLLVGDASVSCFVKDVDSSTYQLTLAAVDGAALGGAQIDLTGGAKPTLTGFAFALACGDHQVTYGNLPAVDFATFVDTHLEPTGVLSNLFYPFIFGVARQNDTAVMPPPDASHTRLQSWAITQNTNATASPVGDLPAYQGRTTTPVKKRFGFLLDRIQTASGKLPDVWLTKTTQRSEYAALLTDVYVNTVYNVNQPKSMPQDPSTKFDGMGSLSKNTGFASFGVPIQFSQNVPEGIYFALTKESWEMLTTVSGGHWVPNDNGGPLHQIIDAATGLKQTSYYASWIMIFQIACFNPQANGALCGGPISL